MRRYNFDLKLITFEIFLIHKSPTLFRFINIEKYCYEKGHVVPSFNIEPRTTKTKTMSMKEVDSKCNNKQCEHNTQTIMKLR